MKRHLFYFFLATLCLASCDFKKSPSQSSAAATEQQDGATSQAVDPSDPYQALVGTKYQDFSMPDIDGKTHSLSEFIHEGKEGRKRYVLVDFWASWCQPCMMELPNVKANWEEYRAKGFDVVGISLDSDSEAWKKAVKDNGYDWTQLSDLGGFDSPAVALYKLEYIPWNFLCDESGTIVAVNLRENGLSAKLKELYGSLK